MRGQCWQDRRVVRPGSAGTLLPRGQPPPPEPFLAQPGSRSSSRGRGPHSAAGAARRLCGAGTPLGNHREEKASRFLEETGRGRGGRGAAAGPEARAPGTRRARCGGGARVLRRRPGTPGGPGGEGSDERESPGVKGGFGGLSCLGRLDC